MTVRFDDALPILVRIVANELGKTSLQSGVVLRDSLGRLAFFSSAWLDDETVERVSGLLRAALGPYARTDRVLAANDAFGAQDILQDRFAFNVSVVGHNLRVVDRRLVGADWLRPPAEVAAPPPRYVFASLKGGVGRSTALAVTAAHLAARARRVLAIDLDMEAPGLGALLLCRNTLPEFGLIDALVENGLAPLDEAFLADLVGPSPLASQRGRIDVIPAFGRRSVDNPGDVLAKIARAYVEDVREDGTVATILDQIRELVNLFADPRRYDAILIDARAGLHETTAASILGLGAEVFLFGLDEPQTYQGYAALLAHLARFVSRNGESPDWLERITMVQGRASDQDSYASFAENVRALIERLGLGPRTADATDAVRLPAEPFNNVPWDEDVPDRDLPLDEDWGPREPLAIFEDVRFRLFQPVARSDLVSEAVYRASFGMFLDRIAESWTGNEEASS